MRLYNKFIFVFTLLVIFANQLSAQPTNLKFDQIGLKQGLSQSTVYAISQDAQGFMWFGTQDGLNRYDGYSIKVFKHIPDDSNSITSDRINCLLSDSKGDLWIGTASGGVDKYILSESKFYHFVHGDNDSLTISNNFINALFEDTEGNIWIGTNEGLNRYNQRNHTIEHFYFDRKDSSRLNGNSVTAICEDKDKNIWVGTYKGLFRLNLRNDFGFIRARNLNTNPPTAYGENVTSLYIDHSGALWVGTYDAALKRYDVKKDTFYSYTNTGKAIKAIYDDSKGNLWLGSGYNNLRVLNLKSERVSQIPIIKNDIINTFYKDKTGILWIGTTFKGAFIYDPNQKQFKHYLNDPQNPNQVMTILEDSKGELWVGTYISGLKHFNKKRDKVTTYRFNPMDSNSISSDKILALCETTEGVLWVGTIGGGLNRLDKTNHTFIHYKQLFPIDKKGLSNNDITALYEDSNGKLWIGNATGGIDILDPKTDTFTHIYSKDNNPNTIGGVRSVTTIREDKKGTIWVGTLTGLKQFVPKLNSVANYRLNQNTNKQKSTFVSVTSLLLEGDIIWIGTSRNGLLRFSPATDSLIFYTTNDGLPNNVVYSILTDKAGNLWLSTNNGISRFNTDTKTYRNYDINDGLQANEFNQGAYFKSTDGEMFFGGVNGFNAFFPKNINDNKYIPPIYITTFRVFNDALQLPSPIPSNTKIELSYSQNFFSFEFVALNYTAPENNQYMYLLEGFDKDWHKVSSSQRYASYTNLDPGEYNLQVKASNNDGLWNEKVASLSIIITPPFWMTWWFKGLGILIFVSIVLFFYYRRIISFKKENVLQQEISKRILEKQEEERSRIALEMHDVLGQDLLLIKNRLLLTLPKTNKTQVVTDNLIKISEDVSKVLNTVREISHNLRPPDLDQLGLTEATKSILFNLRNSTTLKVSGKVDNIDGLLPTETEINIVRIIQEATGNIIKHAEATECRIEITKENNYIYIEINDNGIGFDFNLLGNREIQSSGLGLIGMTERVRILDGTFNIDSIIGKGTRIKIVIPVEVREKE